MFDPKKLESPLNLIINDITPDITGVVLNKLQYRVIDLKSITPYRNTSATLKYFADESDLVGEIRIVEYDRVDIGEYIDEHAKFEISYDNVPTYVMVTEDIEVTTKNAGPSLVSKLLNKEYGLPITPSDLKLISQPGYYTKSTAFGELYLLSNGVVTGDTVTYVNGNTSVYHLPDTKKYSYNKVTGTQPGLAFYRKWTAEETLEITLPSANIAEGWSFMIEDVAAIDSVGNGLLWINLKYDHNKGAWTCVSADGVMHTMVVETIAKLKVNVTNDGVVIEGLALVNNNNYVQQFKIQVPGNKHASGLNRVTMYSTNPFANPISYKFNVGSVGEYGIQNLIPNYKDYITRSNVIIADPQSNGVCGQVKYPIRVTKYDTSNYLQVGSLDSFTGGLVNTGKAMISSVDSFPADQTQILAMHIQELGERMIDGTITKLSFRVTSKSNLIASYKVDLTFKELTEVGAVLKVEAFSNGSLVTISDYTITPDITFITVDVSGYGIGISDNGDNDIGIGSLGEYPTNDATTIKSFKVRMDMDVIKTAELPQVTVVKEYTRTNPL